MFCTTLRYRLRNSTQERTFDIYLNQLRWLRKKALATKPDDLTTHENPHGGRKELTVTSCPLTSTNMPWHAHGHTYRNEEEKRNIPELQMRTHMTTDDIIRSQLESTFLRTYKN